MAAYAVSAIDLALWDLKGKKHGVSISEFIGGRYDAVPGYVTFGVPVNDFANVIDASSAREIDGIAGVQTQIVLDTLTNTGGAPLLIAQAQDSPGAS